nr:hypothetical protein [Fonticella tunisiensis]
MNKATITLSTLSLINEKHMIYTKTKSRLVPIIDIRAKTAD